MAAQILPLTIQCVYYGDYTSIIAIGDNQYTIDHKHNVYWYLVLDRTDGSVVANFESSDNSSIPSELNDYLGNSQYIMILTTRKLNSANIPVGDLYNFLIKEGAGKGLKTMEQIYGSLNCGTWATFGYSFVTVLGENINEGFEYMEFLNKVAVNTLLLAPIQAGDSTLYTPVTLSYSPPSNSN